MHARSILHHLSEQAAEEAFDIAWQFISNTHDIVDEFGAQAFIADEILRLLETGERNRIRLANRAIAAYERAHPESVDCALALDYTGR